MYYSFRPCQPGTFPYIIKPGDTFYRIAMQYNTTVAALIAANPTVNPNYLMIGQQICIPSNDGHVHCPNGTHYTVRYGDTLYSIARQFNVSMADLMEANPGINPYMLYPGQIICIPRPPAVCPPGTQSYTVKAGDTFFSLAQQFNTTVAAIQQANPNVDPNNLQVGQILCIPMGAPVTCPIGTQQYVVRAGDTFFSLAQRFNTTVAAIQQANPNVDPNNLQVGQVLCIPMGTPTVCPPGTLQYTVRAGDTFFSLAIRFNTTVAAIQQANPNVDPNNLRIGQIICIPAGAPNCPIGTQQYTVRAGDTFFSLAQRFNTTVAAIQQANPNVDPNNLIVGEILCIPMGTPTVCPPGTQQYTVRAGDTFFSLAQRFNTTVAAIQQANPNVDPNNLQIGQTLCIPMGTSTTCPTGTQPYTIRSGDTFYSLAQRFNTTVEAIQRANPNVNPNNLQIGQVICIPTSTPPTTCPTGTQPYTIRSGDTFYSLAQRFNTTVEAIQRANPNVNPNNLQIGQVICIPSGGTTPPPSGNCPAGTQPYTIRSGDTFFSLAQRFNTTVEAIQRANPNVNPNNLQIGQVICIPTGRVTSPSANCPAGTQQYTIRSGDTFFSLAQRFNTTVEAIQQANPNVNPNNLQVGQVICIPSGGTTPPPSGSCPAGTQSYTIRSGDTFFSLAQRFNTTVEAIQRANPNVNPNNLQVGQVICIPSGGTTPPPSGSCPAGTQSYTIRSGDTFFSLAQRFNTTVEAIQRANPNVNPNNLQVGQVICIPSGTTPGKCPSGTTAYTVKAGDTFFSLARRFNTTVAAIERANPTVNPNNLQVGQTLCIPNS